MKIVISTLGYHVSEGFATQITLSTGKYFYVEVGSLRERLAKEKGLECKTIKYYGACICANINDRAHRGLPIQIDEVSVEDFIEKIATEEECEKPF